MHAKRIGIRTPFMEGPYYGGLLYHIRRTLQENGFGIIALQTTLQSGLRPDSWSGIPLALERADGWIVVQAPGFEATPEELGLCGKPVVAIELDVAGFLAADGERIEPGEMAASPPDIMEKTFIESAREAVQTLLRLLGSDPEPAQRHVVSAYPAAGSSYTHEQLPFEHIAESPLTYDTYEKIIHNLQVSARNQHEISRHFLNATPTDLKTMSWLEYTGAVWGCYAELRTDECGFPILSIEHLSDPGRMTDIPSNANFRAELFPPLPEPHHDESFWRRHVAEVYPVASGSRLRGYMAIVRPADSGPSRMASFERMTPLLGLFGTALERIELLEFLRRQEETYREMAEKLEIVSGTTTDSIWSWDISTDRLEWTGRIHSLLGSSITDTTLERGRYLELVHPEDLPAMTESMRCHLEHGVPYEIEYRVRRDDGSYMWVLSAGQAIRDEQNKPLRMIGSIRNIDERKQAERRIMYLAYHDSLTGLPNRLLFYTRLQQALEAARRKRRHIAILLIDLDRFKVLNDTFGHQLGDKLLKYIATQLTGSVPENATVARLGGDEFMVLLPDLDAPQTAKDTADSLLRVLQRPFIEGTAEFHVTGSIGVTLYPQDGETVEALIQCADIAMYRAKHEGKNRTSLYAPKMNEQIARRLDLENGLRKALPRGEFVVYYQPQMDLRSGEIYGAEALLRWQSRDHGMVPPLDFIPLAEETGLIVPIGEWVLQEACRQAVRWQQQGLPPMSVAVNISARQFMHTDFIDRVKLVLAETGLPVHKLCLEITESTAIQNIDYSVGLLSELRNLGIRLSMDDFGTGYSSLALLKKLPLHVVKIDKSFIGDITEDPSDSAIVQAIISMSHSIDLQVVAEGVETKEQLLLLWQQGCDSIQGYYVGKAVPSDQLQAMLLRRQAPQK
ncbi:putative bifunctional diguanylate cyclase/phosphodiesterase [Paenibacillus hamazuiensis]|uniref:putative bifunctional diguanylate cyclase/phosphodiesterase n=1 Tax=Paenibacillus hamazuiensis TaxID=2936508 RepID=UPI00200E68BC|nr:GGDEF and EAL domain-containing protein [Paenibacillus hamazuiensis]